MTVAARFRGASEEEGESEGNVAVMVVSFSGAHSLSLHKKYHI